VDQAACNVETEAEKPQNQENDKNRPEHMFLLMLNVGVKRSVRLLSNNAALLLAQEVNSESAASLWQQAVRIVEALPGDSLDPAKHEQNNHNHENQTEAAARSVTPRTAVIPPRQGTHQKQNE
jgi:hypothetical protein